MAKFKIQAGKVLPGLFFSRLAQSGLPLTFCYWLAGKGDNTVNFSKINKSILTAGVETIVIGHKDDSLLLIDCSYQCWWLLHIGLKVVFTNKVLKIRTTTQPFSVICLRRESLIAFFCFSYLHHHRNQHNPSLKTKTIFFLLASTVKTYRIDRPFVFLKVFNTRRRCFTF